MIVDSKDYEMINGKRLKPIRVELLGKVYDGFGVDNLPFELDKESLARKSRDFVCVPRSGCLTPREYAYASCVETASRRSM